jgi:hypothetical protein
MVFANAIFKYLSEFKVLKIISSLGPPNSLGVNLSLKFHQMWKYLKLM